MTAVTDSSGQASFPVIGDIAPSLFVGSLLNYTSQGVVPNSSGTYNIVLTAANGSSANASGISSVFAWFVTNWHIVGIVGLILAVAFGIWYWSRKSAKVAVAALLLLFAGVSVVQAQDNFGVVDMGCNLLINDSTLNTSRLPAKSQLFARVESNHTWLRLYFQSPPATVIAEWDSVHIASLAPTIDSGYRILQLYLGNGCNHCAGATVGPTGPSGPIGATGATGADGQTGATGPAQNLQTTTAVGNVTDYGMQINGEPVNQAGLECSDTTAGSIIAIIPNGSGDMAIAFHNANGGNARFDADSITGGKSPHFHLPNTLISQPFLGVTVNGVGFDNTGNVNVSAWSLIGNSGTDPSVNFIGTSDATQLNIGVNGAYNIQMTPYIASTQNFTYQINDGASQLFSATSNNPSSDNTSVTIGDVQGYWNETLISINDPAQTIYLNAPNITMGGNTQIGSASYVWPNSSSSGSLTNDGSGNLSWGYQTLNQTVAAGNSAGQDILVGADNLTVGEGAFANATNTAFGHSTLASNVSGGNNVAIGYSTLQFNNSGSNNTAINNGALQQNIDGNYDNAIGVSALGSSQHTSRNNTFGYNSMANLTNGNANIAMGDGAMSSANNCNFTVALGYNSCAVTNNADANVGVGTATLYNTTSGYNNTAVGHGALIT